MHVAKAIFLSLILIGKPARAAENSIDSNENAVLMKIQSECMDRWCEGDSRLLFRKVVFDTKNILTKIFFDLKPVQFPMEMQNNDYFASFIDQKTFRVQCDLKGFAAANEIIDDIGDLQPSFVSALSGCINGVEKPLINLVSYIYQFKPGLLDWGWSEAL